VNREQFGEFICALQSQLRVDVVTVYTPDAWQVGHEYRLLWMEGVRDVAPMYGPAFPEDVKRRLLEDHIFRLPVDDVSQNTLFCRSSFADREQIKTLMRYHLLVDPQAKPYAPGAVVFFCFREATVLTVERVAALDVAARAIEEVMRQLPEEPLPSPAEQAQWLARIAQMTRDVIGVSVVDKVVKHVLECALEISGLGNKGYCCLELVRPNRMLECAYRIWQGSFEATPNETADLTKDHNITAMVVREERPLLLSDIRAAIDKPRSRYGEYRPPPEAKDSGFAMGSELAVPMYARGKLIGVLNIESPEAGDLRDVHVRPMEILADQAAIALSEWLLREQWRKLVARASTDWVGQPGAVITRIKALAKEWMNADESDLWGYRDGDFGNPVHPHCTKGRPRSRKSGDSGGFSEWLLTEGLRADPPVKALLVTNMEHDRKTCTLTKGILLKEGFSIEPAGFERKLNPEMDHRTVAEAGLPLWSQTQPIGVLWVKWHSHHDFTRDEVEWLDWLAHEASVALWISDITEDPHVAARARFFTAVFGPRRGNSFAQKPALLAPKFHDSVTVMFADIRTSTQLLDLLRTVHDPVHPDTLLFYSITKEFYDVAREVVFRHDGALATFLGDGVMAIFGEPAHDEQDTGADFSTQQAVLAALDLAKQFRERLTDWKERIVQATGAKPAPEGFGLGVGLHRSWAIVGNFADGEGLVFTAVGDAPTVASRLQDAARRAELLERWPDGMLPPDDVIVLASATVCGQRTDSKTVLRGRLKQAVQLKDLGPRFVEVLQEPGRRTARGGVGA